MEIFVMDKDFNRLTVIDEYESVLWVDRYNKPGEVELYLGADKEILNYLQIGNYLTQALSEHVMLIESIRTETNIEEGNHITIKGRSVECLYGRRIIWTQKDFQNVYFQNAFWTLVNENAGLYAGDERRIPNLVNILSPDDRITQLRITAQYTGDNLLDAMVEICIS